MYVYMYVCMTSSDVISRLFFSKLYPIGGEPETPWETHASRKRLATRVVATRERADLGGDIQLEEMLELY